MEKKEIHCKKVSYTNEKFANEDIKLFCQSGRKIKPTRAYLCLKCNTWHLTSSPINKNVLNRYYSKIERLEKDNKFFRDEVEKLNKERINLVPNYAAFRILGILKQCKEYKLKYNQFRLKYIDKCNELSRFKNDVKKIISKLEDKSIIT